MKLSVSKDVIVDGLQKAANIIPAKSGGAFIRSIWLKAEDGMLSVMTTDANIEFTGVYPAQIDVPGLIGVQGRLLVDLVRQLPAGELKFTLSQDGQTLNLEQGRRSYKLPVTNPDWFQPFSEFPKDDRVLWSGDVLQEIIEKVSFCIADDDAQDAIACLFFRPRENGKVDICGLNGHQFALVSVTQDDLCERLPKNGLLIQKKYLQDIKKWLEATDIELNFTDKKFYLKRVDGKETLSLPRVEYEYPDYNVFMSRLDAKGLSELRLDRKEGIDALGRIGIFNTNAQTCVYLGLHENELNLTVEGGESGSGSENMEAEYNGSISKIAFPTRQLLEVFEHFSSPLLDMKFSDVEGPCSIKGEADGDYTVIIMPMKVTENEYYQEEEKS